MTQSFPSSERIKSKKLLESLFEEGNQIVHPPFRLKYMRCNLEDGATVQIAISVPKRVVRKAARRNKLKRQIKEAYRLNKSDLLSQINEPSDGLALFLIYIGKPDKPYAYLETKVKELLKKLQESI